MIAQNRFVSIFVASRRMSKAGIKGEIKRNWFEANVRIIVDLSDACHNTIVKLLEFKSLGN